MSQDQMNTAALRADITLEEGKRNLIYRDSRGFWTAGVGRNMSSVGLSDAEIDYLLSNDIERAIGDLDRNVSWWRNLDVVRGGAMIDLCFNMGWGTLGQFHHFLAAMQASDWQTAADELESSAWWHEVGQRGPMVRGRVLTGVN